VTIADGGEQVQLAALRQLGGGGHLRLAGLAQPGVQDGRVVGGAGVLGQVDLQVVGVDVR
jgi:hypothetical protein